MTKLIALLVVLAALFGGYQLFLYYDRVKAQDEQSPQPQAAAPASVSPRQLSGMPSQLESSLEAATKLGATGLRNWLKAYSASISDPRKAWIELDYCVLLSQENPAEARRIFSDVKNRTPDSSPVWPRIKQLEKTYD